MSEQTDRLFPGRHFINATLEAVETKAAMSTQITVPYLQRAGMAGILIGTFYGAYYSTVATFAQIPAGETTLVGVGRVLGSLVFGWALVFIYFTKSELLTSNMMVATIGGGG